MLLVFPQGTLQAYSASTQSGMSDSSAGGNISGLSFSNKKLQKIGLGGPASNGSAKGLNNFENLVVKRVAVFTDQITAAEAAAYVFPSEAEHAAATAAETPWETAFPTWDDDADNSGRTLYIDIAEGASLVKTTAISVKQIVVSGSGTLTLSGGVTASDGIVVSAGTTLEVSSSVASPITNFGTLNASGSTFSGAVSNSGTLNTSGTVSFSSSAVNSSSGTFRVVDGTTTYNSNSDKKISGSLHIEQGATFVNAKGDSIPWDGTAHVYIRGTVTMNAKWTVGANNYLHLYGGALINGSASNALHFNTGQGKLIAEEGESAITAPVVKGGGTISIEAKDGATLALPNHTTFAFAKSGAGTVRIKNARLDNVTGSEGVIELYSDETYNSTYHAHVSTGIPFSGTVRVVTANNSHQIFLWSSNATAGMFSNRPVLDASGDMWLYKKINAYPLQVKNLTGNGGFRLNDDGDGYRYVDTLQTEDSIFSGRFYTVSGHETYDSALTVRGADDATEVHSLTLSGDNTTTGPLDVENNAKVVFASTGRWASGNVTVKSGGVLESQNSSSIAATLKVQEGATLSFASGVQLLASAYDWSEISNDASVNIDISAIAPTSTPVTLIASGVTLDAAKFAVSASQTPVSLSVENGALVAVFANVWRNGEWTGSVTANGNAALYISENSTLTVAEDLSLADVNVVREGDSDVVLTVSGSGALSTGGWTIPSGVTLVTADGMGISGAVSGTGVINVPVITTLTMDGVVCPETQVAVYGILKTSGATTLGSTANVISASGTLDVLDGTTNLKTTNQGIQGAVYIRSGATLASNTNDSLTYEASETYPAHVHVYGTLTLNDSWTIAQSDYIHLYNGASIGGSKLHFNKNTGTVIAEEGTSSITAPLEKGVGTVSVQTKEGTLLEIASSLQLQKSGPGTLRLKNVALAHVVSGSEGTLELYNGTGSHQTHTATGVTFSGTIKFTATGSNGHIISNTGFLATGTRPQFELNTGTTTYKKLFFHTSYNNNSINIRDLKGSGDLTAKYSGGTAQNQTLDNVQTQPTEFSGNLLTDDSNGDKEHKTNLFVHGDGSGTVNALTLSGVNTSVGGLTVSGDAKVVFASTGSWANGLVTVGDGGVLESQNSSSIAAMLKVQEGATLSFASGVELLATAYDWSEISNDASVNIDVSAIAPTTESVTLIASGVTLDAAKFAVSASQCPATLTVEEGALKVSFSNYWRDGTWEAGPAAGGGATLFISQNSTLTVSEALALGDIKVVNEAGGDVVLTVSGAGTLATGGWTIPAGVTLVTADGMEISGGVSGAGVIRIPVDTTLVMDGVACSAKVVVEGTLQTKGTTNLSAANTSAAGSLIEVVSGATTLATAINGIFGDITIGSAENGSAQLTMGASYSGGTDQGWDWLGNASTTCIDIYGTLSLGQGNLILYAGDSIKLRAGATIVGDATGFAATYGSLAFVGNAAVQVFGNATINAHINSRTGTSPVFTIDENATLTVSQTFTGQTSSNNSIAYFCGGSLTKAGAGTLDLTAITMSKPLTINAGTVVSSAVPTGAVTINENGTFRLNSASWSTDVFNGDGILELNSNTEAFSAYSAKSNFGGTIKVIGNTSKTPHFGAAEGMFLNRPKLELTSYMTLNSNFIGENSAMTVKNLTGASGSRVDPYNNSGYNGERFISTCQTESSTFAGTFVSDNNRKTSLKVYGEAATGTQSLSLTAENTTTGPLIVDAYGKVVFSGSGSWLNGTTTVKAGGVLESQRDAQVVGALTLEADATLSFAEGYSLQTGAITLPESGTVTLDISALTLSASGTTLIQSSSITTSTDLSKFSVSDGYYLEARSDVLMVFPLGASLTYTEGGETTTTSYATINDAISAAYTREYLGNTYDYITAYASGSATAYASTVKVKLENGAVLILNVGSEEYGSYSAGSPDSDGIVTYTVTLSPTTYVWSNPIGGNWNLLGNWKYIDSNDAEQNATRTPTSVDTVIFNDGASVTHSTAVTVAGITVNGSVAVSGSSSLETSGNITGSGTLSINGGGIASAATGLTVAPNVVFAAGTYIACGSGGGSLTFNGDVSLPAGTVSLWNSGHTFAGTTTLNGDYSNGGNQTLTLGAVSVAASSSISGKVVFGGAISIGNGITLATPASNVSFSGASLSGAGTLSLGAMPAAALGFSNWTGTVELPSFAAAGQNLNNYGVAGSKVKIAGITGGWLGMGTTGTKFTINPEIVLAGNLVLDDSSMRTWEFTKVSGQGGFSLTPGSNGYKIGVTIAELVGSGVSFVNNMGNVLTISKQTLSAAPSAGDRLVATTTPNNLTLSAVYVGDAQQTNLILAKRDDGIYVAAVEEAVTVGEDSVTSLATASWATTLDASGINGKVAIPGTVTQITGVTAANLLLKATYTPEGGSEMTAYYPGILALDASGNVSLDSTASATVGSETVSVAPALDTAAASPMAVADAEPSFAVKTVPGLKYKVVAATALGESGALAGTTTEGASVQATSTSTTVAAPAFPAGANVLYYKIGAEL